MGDEFDVFLSHNNRDKRLVEDIAKRLRDRGLTVWLDKWELRPGLQWQEGLEGGLRASKAVAICIGGAALGTWQNPEMRAALSRAQHEQIPVIPVLLPGCPDTPQLALFLKALTWVDLRHGLDDEGLAQLIWGITGVKAEPQPESEAESSLAPERRRPPGLLTWPRRRRQRLPRAWVIALGVLGVVTTLAARLWPLPAPIPRPGPPDVYPLRVEVESPKGEPVSGGNVGASVANRSVHLAGGSWQIEIPAASLPGDGRVSVWAMHPAWGGNSESIQVGAYSSHRVEIHLKAPSSWLRDSMFVATDRRVPVLAEPLLRRALDSDQTSLGLNHPKVAIDLGNLAALMQDTNRLAEAESLIRQALDIDRNSSRQPPSIVAVHLNILAQLLQDTNRPAEAEPLVRRALAAHANRFGSDHAIVATDLNILAQLLWARNRVGEAEPLLRRALAIDEKSIGRQHSPAARDLNNLALLLQASGRSAEAEPLMRRAVAILAAIERWNAQEHPNWAVTAKNYRSLLEKLGKSAAESDAAVNRLLAEG